MKFNTKFSLYEKIYITDLKIYGNVIVIYVNNKDRIQYNIRYFNGTEIKEVYFYEDELSCEKPKEMIGLATNEK